MKLSVLMPVYYRESPEFLRQCLASLAAQTVAADEIVIVEDGPLGAELEGVIRIAGQTLPIVSVRLPVHGGLGTALSAGLDACGSELVARMDADDLCTPDRFRRQIDFMERNPEVDVVGSAIAEFGSDPLAIESVRRLPASGRALMSFAKLRNPLNHMTVMFRRRAVLDAGSYKPCADFEDYHLWARMLRRGCRLHNLPDALVQVRCGNGMQRRRGGWAYLIGEIAFQRFLHRIGFISASNGLRNVLARAPIRLVPAQIRSAFYLYFLRERAPRNRGLTIE